MLRTDEGNARELWFVAPRAVEVRAGHEPVAGPGQVLVRCVASSISQGTELLLYRGLGPTPFDPSLDLPGAPTYPRRYGYAWVGDVIARDAAVDGIEVGTRVFALAPHGDFHALDADVVRPIDPAIPPARAVLAASLETAITCVWDAGVSLGDRVVVLGGGIVGLLAAWLAEAAGASVRLVEPSAARRDLARALGVSAVVTLEEDRPCGDADVVIEATGDPSALDRAIAHTATEGTIAVLSFYGIRTHPVALGSDFHRRRLLLRATQVSSIPPAHAPRWTPSRRFDLVRRLLCDAVLDRLLPDIVPFDDAPRAYARLDQEPGSKAHVVFDYG
jgi:2-desacetyl-2-hydroxyethyl bacteriochlorophyllide A dehydrogenase